MYTQHFYLSYAYQEKIETHIHTAPPFYIACEQCLFIFQPVITEKKYFCWQATSLKQKFLPWGTSKCCLPLFFIWLHQTSILNGTMALSNAPHYVFLLCMWVFSSCMRIIFFAAQYFIPYGWNTCKALSAWQSFSVFFKNNLFKYFLIQISALCSLEQGTYLIFKYKEFLSTISKSIFKGGNLIHSAQKKLKICKISNSPVCIILVLA